MRRPPTPDPDRIRLDTLDTLHQHGHGIGGYCLVCRKLFAVDMAALVAERGTDSPIIGMKPLRCRAAASGLSGG
jgi:hypothetical protein